MLQVNAGWSFLDPYGAPKPVHLKLDASHYVRRPTLHATYSGRRKGKGWGGEMGEVVPSRAFFTFFVPGTSLQPSA